MIFDTQAEDLLAEVLMEESPNVLLETDNLSEILQYQSQLLAIEDKLQEAGIVQEGGIWYFDNAKKVESWPKIVGK